MKNNLRKNVEGKMQYQLQRIIDISDRLVEKYGTRDPFEIADCLREC